MSTFPKNFPFGKNIWLWNLPECEGGNIQKIIKRLQDNDIQMALIKCGDGENTWEQWNQELVDAFHAAGLKIYSWSFVYGKNPLREAAIANWALDMGADGHVFDAEDQYEHVANPGGAATTMLEAVRAHSPHALLGHSPEPIIDYHQHFPYVEFGKYCDFVMPQVYFGEWGKSATDGVNWVYEQWAKWEKVWSSNGFSDSIKPLIMVHQTFDWVATIAGIPDYTVTPASIAEFVKAVEGYKAVSFYEYAHILRIDCWEAIRDNKVLAPTYEELCLSDNKNPQTTPTGTQPEVAPATTASVQTPAEANSSPLNGSTIAEATEKAVTPPAKTAISSDNLKWPDLPHTVDLPKNGHTVITLTKNPTTPTGVKIQVLHHTPHAIVVKQFFTSIFHMVCIALKTTKNKGGEQKK